MAGMTLAQIAIYIIVIAAIVAIVYVALQQFGIQIPLFVQRIFWICVCCVLAVLAIKFLLTV